jgi:hypothetical protein
MQPPLSSILFFGFFLVLWQVPEVIDVIVQAISQIFIALGLNPYYMLEAFRACLYGSM